MLSAHLLIMHYVWMVFLSWQSTNGMFNVFFYERDLRHVISLFIRCYIVQNLKKKAHLIEALNFTICMLGTDERICVYFFFIWYLFGVFFGFFFFVDIFMERNLSVVRHIQSRICMCLNSIKQCTTGMRRNGKGWTLDISP